MVKFNKLYIIVFVTFMSLGKLLYLPDAIERIETSMVFTIYGISVEINETIE